MAAASRHSRPPFGGLAIHRLFDGQMGNVSLSIRRRLRSGPGYLTIFEGNITASTKRRMDAPVFLKQCTSFGAT